MNIISTAISVFISNYIIIAIIRLLPLKKKTLWQTIILSFYNLGSIVGYLWMILSANELSLLLILELLSSILGVVIAYTASMMIVLDGIVLFKSKRLREFERSYHQKDGTSIPRNILAVISLSLSIALFTYGIVSLLNYDKRLLISCIGTFLGMAIFLGLAIYFFISGKAQHKTIKAENLLLIVQIEDKKILLAAELSKDQTLETLLSPLADIYILDEYGLIVTPHMRYIVKGVKLDYLSKDILKSLQMQPFTDSVLNEALKEFQKYNRKKIILDENYSIKKISIIK
ncbi:MAG: hypothetical protein K2P14_04050 [Anaeroplasmataceae bacterium]|jgi:hypothetical protein|nr:hypothetical protein [Anaeroplasmataceae bacterium]